MGTRLVFASLKSPNIRYVVYESFCDNPTRQTGFDDRVTAFDTYGDGNVQHCHEWSVPADDMGDFLESLMFYLNSHDVEEWRAVLCRMWPSEFDHKNAREVIAFASKPLFKEDKNAFHRTFNLRECKVSTSPAKQHDRRWDKVESWMDGSFQAFMNLTAQYRPGGTLGLWMWAEFVFDNSGYCQYHFRQWMKIEPETYRRIRDAFETCDAYIRAAERIYRTRQWVESRCENLTRRMERDAETVSA